MASNIMTEEELAGFASGIKSSDIDLKSMEKACPNKIRESREGVLYGSFSHGVYYSEFCKMERGYSILLPPSYDGEKKYPVLYLLHGIFGDEYSFSNDADNNIKEIIRNMYLDGKVRELILVCPNMFATDDPNQKPDFTKEACIPYDNFIYDLVSDLMPHIEKNYSVLTGRENTFLAGFSMGGRETIFITLKRPELFKYTCAIAPAPGLIPTKDKFMEHEGQMEEKDFCFAKDAYEPDAFIICCGDSDSVVGTYPKSYHEHFKTKKLHHIWYEIEGADHDNNAVRSGLYNFLIRIGI